MGDVEFFDEDGRILDSCLSGFRKEEHPILQQNVSFVGNYLVFLDGKNQ
jgi:hypothetical protein